MSTDRDVDRLLYGKGVLGSGAQLHVYTSLASDEQAARDRSFILRWDGAAWGFALSGHLVAEQDDPMATVLLRFDGVAWAAFGKASSTTCNRTSRGETSPHLGVTEPWCGPLGRSRSDLRRLRDACDDQQSTAGKVEHRAVPRAQTHQRERVRAEPCRRRLQVLEAQRRGASRQARRSRLPRRGVRRLQAGTQEERGGGGLPGLWGRTAGGPLIGVAPNCC